MPDRIAADGMHVAGRQLDQALVQRSLGQVRGAHPGRLEELVRLEEVAALVCLQARFESRAAPLRWYRPIGLGPVACMIVPGLLR